MTYRPTTHAKLFYLVAAIALFCVSSESKTSPVEQHDTSKTKADKCVIDLAAPPQQCDISIGADDRVVWKNSSTSPLYACVDPQQTPFEGYGWYVPGKGKRLSGKMRRDAAVNLAGVAYYPSPNICVWPPPASTKSTPIIIIHPTQ